jgi:aspartokinase-like uncharacterized kinase
MAEMFPAPVVVKVGGSLFSMPDLGQRLRRWLTAQGETRFILVPGGGAVADVVRDLDRQHFLGEETSHWLALRALDLNAEFLAAILGDAPGQVIEDLGACRALWSRGGIPIMAARAFARADEGRPGCLPHSWSVTSDSLAARLAVVCGASDLVLLKSVAIPEGIGWQQASEIGLVDRYFPQIADQLARIRTINFRDGECE